MNHTPHIIYWIATGYLHGIGPVNLRKLLEIFGDIKAFFTASTEALQHAGLNPTQIDSVKNIPWKKIENDLKWCEQHHCHLLTWQDEHYPILLRELSGSPPILYVRGNKDLLHQPQLAIVGSRNPSRMGIETAEEFAYALVKAGLIITSGLALGIDTAGHKGALAAGGNTIAMMGTGIREIYPKSNFKLAEEILLKGAIVSELVPTTPANAKCFPLRNRLISGLSLGTLVVEAALRSGSLITAHYAVEQGREVFAIPGSIHHPLAKGCHQLIREGAKLVENVEDILVELNSLFKVMLEKKPINQRSKSKNLKDLDKIQQHLLKQIGYEATSLDTIALRSGLTTTQVSSMLLSLELEGYIDSVMGGYSRHRE